MSVRKDEVWTRNGSVFMPDIEVTPMYHYRYEALKGYAYVLAAFWHDECIGYVMSEALGYPTAKAWLERDW